ncbi:MAG: (2Fe-2S)-binding protein [Gracilibacter sp. BRH_c7a]|nr:MAG: (2Fe-2S)-binding protein [Gracilibacter sp. BRH_c7a]
MMEEGLNNCCCESTVGLTCEIEESSCPVCKTLGSKVKRVTVEHLVLESLTELVGDSDYYLCMNEECNVVYYNKETSFSKRQVKVPIWFKNGANPKYACYCSKVTEEQVINAVVNDRADNMKEVLRITGAMKDAQCEKNNPLGKCCHHIIQNAIDKGLSMRQ